MTSEVRPLYILQDERLVQRFNGGGGSQDFDRFEEQMRDYWELRPHFTPAQKKSSLLRRLGPIVRDELACHNEMVDGDAVLETLRSVYGEQRSVAQLMLQFYGIQQQPYENLRIYSHRVVAAFNTLTKMQRRKEQSVTPDTVLRDQFLDGLIDSHLKMHLRHYRVQNQEVTFLELRNFALEISDTDPEPTSIDAAVQNPRTISTEIELLQKQVTALTEKLTQRADNLYRPAKNHQLQRWQSDQLHRHQLSPTAKCNNRAKFTQPAKPKSAMPHGACFSCNLPGHYRQDCPMLRRSAFNSYQPRKEIPRRPLHTPKTVNPTYSNSVPYQPRPTYAPTRNPPPEAPFPHVYVRQQSALPDTNRYPTKKVCLKCGRRGHVKMNCRSLTTKPRPVKCFRCRQRGHIAHNCPLNHSHESTSAISSQQITVQSVETQTRPEPLSAPLVSKATNTSPPHKIDVQVQTDSYVYPLSKPVCIARHTQTPDVSPPTPYATDTRPLHSPHYASRFRRNFPAEAKQHYDDYDDDDDDDIPVVQSSRRKMFRHRMQSPPPQLEDDNYSVLHSPVKRVRFARELTKYQFDDNPGAMFY